MEIDRPISGHGKSNVHLLATTKLQYNSCTVQTKYTSVTVSCYSSTLPSFIINHSSAKPELRSFREDSTHPPFRVAFLSPKNSGIAHIHHASFINFPSLPLSLFLPSFGAPLVIVASPWRALIGSRLVTVLRLLGVGFHEEVGGMDSPFGLTGWYPSCLTPARSPLKGDIPSKYPLYKVYTGLIIKGTIPRVPPFSL